MIKKKETRAEAVARLGGWNGKTEGVLELRYCRACETEVDAVDGECTKCGQPTEEVVQMNRNFTKEELALIVWGLQRVEEELVHEFEDADTAEKVAHLAYELKVKGGLIK